MTDEPIFDHEKLDVYKRAIEFVALAGDLIDGPLNDCRLSAVDQLDRGSTSVPLNIAEGNGKWTVRDRCRYFDTARGSAFECAAALDVLVARRRLSAEFTREPKRVLLKVGAMLSKMTLRLQEDERRGMSHPGFRSPRAPKATDLDGTPTSEDPTR